MGYPRYSTEYVGVKNVIETRCHCGDVTVAIPNTPDKLTSCNCSSCFRIGALWSYYTLADVEISAPEGGVEYIWGDCMMVIHSCSRCGCTTHYVAVEGGPEARVGVNMRMAPREITEAIPVRRFDGADTWTFID